MGVQTVSLLALFAAIPPLVPLPVEQLLRRRGQLERLETRRDAG